MIDTKQTVDVYDNIHRLLYHFNKGHGRNDLSDLHHDIFLKIHDKFDQITHLKAYLYKTCFWAHHNWLKNRDFHEKRKIQLEDNTLPENYQSTFDIEQRTTDMIALHQINVDSRVVVTFRDGQRSYYSSGAKVAEELRMSKSAINEWIRNGGVSFRTSKTFIVEDIRKLDYIYNPFKNGVKVVKLLSKSTFDKQQLNEKWVLLDKDTHHELYINKMNEGLIVKTNYNPFNGGTIQVDRMGISLKTFENNKSTKYVDYVRDEYHSNEHYEIWSNGTDAVLIKLKKKD